MIANGDMCEDHPTYAAKRKPKLACEPCWRIWIAKQDYPSEIACGCGGDSWCSSFPVKVY